MRVRLSHTAQPLWPNGPEIAFILITTPLNLPPTQTIPCQYRRRATMQVYWTDYTTVSGRSLTRFWDSRASGRKEPLISLSCCNGGVLSGRLGPNLSIRMGRPSPSAGAVEKKDSSKRKQLETQNPEAIVSNIPLRRKT